MHNGQYGNWWRFGDIYYLPIMKNAHKWARGIPKNAERYKYASNKKPDIIILRDPLERWISGSAQFHYNSLDKGWQSLDEIVKYCFDKIEQDVHTIKQTSYLENVDTSEATWFYINESFQQSYIDWLIEHRVELKPKDRWNFNSASESDAKLKIINRLRKELEDPEKAKQIVDFYAEDYKLIESVEFYST
jgi:hypothetical protein